jgi:MoaA/NifB/PqqE/SkfB family radical SAM enzyme
MPRLLFNRRLLEPLVVAYTVTTHCNLNCVYCEDFGARRNADQPPPLALAEAQRLLTILRQATNSLLLTGGEPLLYPEIEALLAHAKEAARFRHVTMLSNASRLADHWDVLRYIDRLMVSVDATTPAQWDVSLGAEAGTAQRILDNVADAAGRRRPDHLEIVVNCVVTPETLDGAGRVLAFCEDHNLLFSFSPQSSNNWPRYELLVSDAYRAFVTRMIEAKRRGAPVLGSLAYLKKMVAFEPYACYPMLAPRVMSGGGLAYPCRPIEREDDAHGGREINLLDVGSWRAAVEQAAARYDLPPSTCGSCFQQCYAEPSLMQAKPWALLYEHLRFPPSRRGHLATYAPG